jgi:hypothetical protein
MQKIPPILPPSSPANSNTVILSKPSGANYSLAGRPIQCIFLLIHQSSSFYLVRTEYSNNNNNVHQRHYSSRTVQQPAHVQPSYSSELNSTRNSGALIIIINCALCCRTIGPNSAQLNVWRCQQRLAWYYSTFRTGDDNTGT